MDKNRGNYNGEEVGVKVKALSDGVSPNVVLNEEEEDDDETARLLPPRIGGGLSRKKDQMDQKKAQRKVHWKDNSGKKLTEVLEYQPSEVSESDDEESDSCICRIM